MKSPSKKDVDIVRLSAPNEREIAYFFWRLKILFDFDFCQQNVDIQRHVRSKYGPKTDLNKWRQIGVKLASTFNLFLGFYIIKINGTNFLDNILLKQYHCKKENCYEFICNATWHNSLE